MTDEQKIEELQKRINQLSADLKDQYQTLQSLQQELHGLQGKKIVTTHTGTGSPKRTQTNFSFENFIGLRLIHFVGIIVLVIGLSIGVKYAIDRELMSEAARIILAYLAGLILFGLSWYLRKKYEFFSAILFSGAMASLYFTTYAAFVYYSFFSFGVAFGLMVAFTIFTVYQSIHYNRQEIAVLGMVGAYGIPFLISANSERADLLFSYIILINLGVVFLSFKKKWKLMSQLALYISWVLFILWGLFRYEEKDFLTGLVLMITFFFLFTVSAIAYKIIRSESLSPVEIQQVMVNNFALYLSALIIFGFGNFGTNAAGTTGWFVALMITLALLSYFLFPTEIILQQTLAMQSVLALTIFIALNWSGFTVTLLWTLLAVVLFVWGVYSHRSWPRLAGMLLMALTLGKLMIFDSAKFTTIQKIISYIVIGSLLLVLSFLYQKFKQTLFGERKE